ncbi:MAG TPA: stage V sporulation protein AC [Firmicutes bacterium]|nr:stage V sporulation protein AC [Bacillota bacterium]HBS93148.1 stage V sporulation protein AC [Bacillota bacterium]HCX79212.1 stage V sporulation protein AC [Bacillota bacterium]
MNILKDLLKDPAAYQALANEKKPKPRLAKNLTMAFLVGGGICTLGQLIQNIYIKFFNFPPERAGDPTTTTVIFISGLLTALGVFDKIARHAGAGTAVPVTGFANSIVSAALEFKREGFVLGVGSKMFILAGSVIVFGVVTAFVVGLISALL